jgi:hypothetical protein
LKIEFVSHLMATHLVENFGSFMALLLKFCTGHPSG